MPRVRFLFLAVLLVIGRHLSAAPSRQIVVIVFDGMRPDFIGPGTTPNLAALRQEGVYFEHHHPVYLSATEVNGAAIATGMYPSHSSIIANVDFRPKIDPQKTIAIEDPATVARGDLVSGGHYLRAPTVAEILHGAGLRTVIAGSKQVALLHDRARRTASDHGSIVLFEGATYPVNVQGELSAELGPFPDVGQTGEKSARDNWTTTALIGPLWRKGLPTFSLLWLADPDYAQHTAGPGSALALVAIKNSDAKLGQVLAELDRRRLRDTTDVLVVSDHGFSTISRRVDVATEISKAGFQAKRETPGGLRRSEVLVVSDGGSSLFYVGQHDPAVTQRLAMFLQEQDWAGVIFSRENMPGTFPLAEARIDSPDAPDLVVALHWSHDRSSNGTPGLITSDSPSNSPRMGGHASLSPYELHNTLIAAGPDFREGVRDTLATGNTDLAPTILWLLGQREAAAKMDGRVLTEALTVSGPALRSYEPNRLTAERKLAHGTWEQYLEVSEINGVRYLDEGGSTIIPEKAP